MGWYQISALCATIFVSCVGFYIYIKNKDAKLNKTFFLMNLSIALWNCSDFFVVFLQKEINPLIIVRISYVGAIFIAPFFAKLIFLITEDYNKKFYKKFFTVSVCLSFILFVINFTNLFVRNVIISPYREETGPLYIAFPVFFTIVILYSLYCLAILFFKTKSNLKKIQVTYIFSGLFIGVIAVFTYFITLARAGIDSPHFFIEILYISIMTYAIFAHRIMDIDLAWRKILAYVIYLVIMLAMMFIALEFLLKIGIHYMLTVIVIAFVMLIAAPYLRKKIMQVAHNIFLKKYKTVWDELKKIAEDKAHIYDMKEVIQIFLYEVVKIMGIEYGSYYAINEVISKFVLFDTTNKKYSAEEIPFNHSLIKYLEMHMKIISYTNMADIAGKEEIKEFFEKNKIELCYPVFSGNKLVGIFTYGKKEKGKIYHQEDIEILKELIQKGQEQIKHILYTKYASDNYAKEILERYKDTYQTQVVDELRRAGNYRTVKELFEYGAKLTNRSVKAEYVYFYGYDYKTHEYVYIAGTKNDKTLPKRIKESDALMKYLRDVGKMVSKNQLKKWADETKSQEFIRAYERIEELKGCYIGPFIDITLLGFFVVGEKQGLEQYTKDDLTILGLMGDKIGSTLSTIYAWDKADKDPMLDIGNKGYLEKRTKEEVAYSMKYGSSVSYLLPDADEFKWFNDHHDYSVGDEVIKAIVECIKGIIRPTDEFCRFGGEELPIIAKGTDLEGAKSLAEKIINKINTDSKILELGKKYGHKISVSIGVSTFKPTDRIGDITNEEVDKITSMLVYKANMGLKQAKKNGRNQYCQTILFTEKDKE
jgi:diguanylate cyclase (GGDEF)-like protein